MINFLKVFICFFGWIGLFSPICFAGTKSKPHHHQGVLQPYDGKHIAYKITLEDEAKLESGQPLIVQERKGGNGRGSVILDVNASPETCMNQIRNVSNYPNVVSKVKKVNIYDVKTSENGTVHTYTEFFVGIPFFKFHYFLVLKFAPRYYTVTWTLDYQYSSDFEDVTGHWQVMPHPTKVGWTRIFYSTEGKMPSWVPEFVLAFLNKAALLEATSWVKRESEDADSNIAANERSRWNLPSLSDCYITDNEFSRYETHCIEAPIHMHEHPEL